LPIPTAVDFSLSPQVQVCAACHSLRTELEHRDVAADYFSGYNLSALLEGLYHPDGQIREEVYVTGSFLQSKMHANLVSCSNCHEPHGNALRIPGNGLCLQCHEARTFQTEEHFFHDPDSTGAQCVNCHMPAQIYMGVDARRDHSFRIPDPIASVELGVPNACTQCHTDRDDEWAAAFITERTGRTEPIYAHARLFAAARANDNAISSDLAAFARDTNAPAILRSTALVESARFPSQAHLRAVVDALDSPDPLLRGSAAAAVSFLDPVQRLQYLGGLLDDPAKAVRMAVARQLVDVPVAAAPATVRPQLSALLSEYEASLLYNADMPEAMSELGLLYARRGDLEAARDALLHARKLAPRFLGAMINLADVYRALGRDGLGERVLDEALEEYPESGDAHHALGLLYVRTGRTPASVELFARARELSPENAQYALVHALALIQVGKVAEGMNVLETAAARFPRDARIRDALQAYRTR
jgi:predicted CXXCH cytochrome family protein